MHSRLRHIILCMLVVCLLPLQAYGQRVGHNQVEVGVQGGMMYYVGDANPKMFQNIREAYGAEVSYLFNKRWSVMLQCTAGRLAGRAATEQGLPDPNGEMWTNYMVSIDATARFNFLPFGLSDKYDLKVKPYTPYIYAGIGMSMHQGFTQYAAYFPVGIGFRWVCSEHIGMYLAWQNNLCFADNLEPDPLYNNIHELNGSNVLNLDIVSTIQFGIVFEFAKEKSVCKFCKEKY